MIVVVVAIEYKLNEGEGYKDGKECERAVWPPFRRATRTIRRRLWLVILNRQFEGLRPVIELQSCRSFEDA